MRCIISAVTERPDRFCWGLPRDEGDVSLLFFTPSSEELLGLRTTAFSLGPPRDPENMPVNTDRRVLVSDASRLSGLAALGRDAELQAWSPLEPEVFEWSRSAAKASIAASCRRRILFSAARRTTSGWPSSCCSNLQFSWRRKLASSARPPGKPAALDGTYGSCPLRLGLEAGAMREVGDIASSAPCKLMDLSDAPLCSD
mmetsp:Transcript_133435/g.243174  ORF Transcript_133435/g.243174 Transcript_133435/m.243174 type:complete len:200 (+) Transcript_133435:694-1293(+)